MEEIWKPATVLHGLQRAADRRLCSDHEHGRTGTAHGHTRGPLVIRSNKRNNTTIRCTTPLPLPTPDCPVGG